MAHVHFNQAQAAYMYNGESRRENQTNSSTM